MNQRINDAVLVNIRALQEGQGNELMNRLHEGVGSARAKIEKIPGLDRRVIDSYSIANSAELYPQIAIACLPLLGKPTVARRAGEILTFGDVLDNFFDDPGALPDYKTLFRYREDVNALAEASGPVGELINAMTGLVPEVNAEVMRRAIKKIVYGSLIQLSSNPERVKELATEYQQFALSHLHDDLASQAQSVNARTYWITTKAPFELVDGAREEPFDYNRGEAASMIFAPSRYWYNIREEKQNGQDHVSSEFAPTSEDMAQMTLIGGKYALSKANGGRKRLATQWGLLLKAIEDRLPRQERRALEELIELANARPTLQGLGDLPSDILK